MSKAKYRLKCEVSIDACSQDWDEDQCKHRLYVLWYQGVCSCPQGHNHTTFANYGWRQQSHVALKILWEGCTAKWFERIKFVGGFVPCVWLNKHVSSEASHQAGSHPCDYPVNAQSKLCFKSRMQPLLETLLANNALCQDLTTMKHQHAGLMLGCFQRVSCS